MTGPVPSRYNSQRCGEPRCRDIGTADTIGEGYPGLDNPFKIEGNTCTWLDGKPDPVAFTAVIENGVLTSVNCL